MDEYEYNAYDINIILLPDKECKRIKLQSMKDGKTFKIKLIENNC